MYQSSSGWPLFLATHYREPKCGPHVHTVCDANGCTSHIDRWNPDCAGELGPHMRDDFLRAHGDWVVPLVAIGVFALAAALLS